MIVISVNIGRAQSIEIGKNNRLTGIFKIPAPSAVRVAALGLEGDAVCNSKHHGGVDQAVYIYGKPDYDWWSAELGRELPPGTFGENLTIGGLESATFSIGDRLRLDEIVLEVTAPRIPCATLATRMGDPAFVKKYRQAERPGLYCRVLQEGYVRAGETVTLERYTGAPLTALEMFRDYYDDQWNEALIRRHLAAPIAIRDRVDMEKKLAKLRSGGMPG